MNAGPGIHAAFLSVIHQYLVSADLYIGKIPRKFFGHNFFSGSVKQAQFVSGLPLIFQNESYVAAAMEYALYFFI